MNCDVLVVGAGPAGAVAALTCARLGLRTIVVEEHPLVGSPAHCAGKVPVHAFGRFDLPLRLAQCALRAARLHAPDGTVAEVRRREADSYVVDRGAFDRFLAERAARAGAELLTGARAMSVERARGRAAGAAGPLRVGVELGGRRVEVVASVVIDAEGVSPVLPRQLGIAPRRLCVRGMKYEMEGVEGPGDDDSPDLVFGREVAPGFFGWVMPAGGGRARVGVAVDPRLTFRPPAHYLERLIASHPAVAPRLRRARIAARLAGRIPILGLRRPTYTEGMLVAGDAAAHVKATSGGGIYFAMIAGELSAAAAAGRVGGGAGAFEGYERGWKAAFGREIRFTTVARQALNRLSDAHISAVVRALAEDGGIRAAVEDHGDTQYQSRVMLPLLSSFARAGLRRPRLAGAAVAAGCALLLGLAREATPTGSGV